MTKAAINTPADPFTAARIAEVLGGDARAIRRLLEGNGADALTYTRGKFARNYHFSALPESLRLRLEGIAQSRGYDSPERLLMRDAPQWQPAVPAAEIHPEESNRAKLLAGALGYWVRCWSEGTRPAFEAMEGARAAHRQALGYEVAPATMEKTMRRAIARDNGRGEFFRWELYLPESPRRQIPPVAGAEFERGLLGNLVAARCQRISNSDTIAGPWWLQQVSWREGGLEEFARAFLAARPGLAGTPSMHRFGMRAGQVYDAEQVRADRPEIGGVRGRFFYKDFSLRGERGNRRPVIDYDGEEYEYSEHEAAGHPDGYPVEVFIAACECEPPALAEHLKRLLVDPQSQPERGLWNLPGLWPALREAREQERAVAAAGIVETSVARQVFDELDYALEARTFVLVEGREGIGKSEAARAWCARNAGRAVYVRLESGADETTLYRSIARATGTARACARKAVEMRARIQDTLQTGQLMLVLDEAHFLWPQSERRERSAPKRVDWLRTALVDFGVPVALVSTPQYFARACDRFRKAGWNANQIQRRLARTVTLPEPDALPLDDILAVARSHFPEADAASLKRIAAAALASLGFLTSIRHLRQRVDFLARRRPGKSGADVLAEALQDVLPAPAPVLTPAEKPLKPVLNQARPQTFSAVAARRASSGRLIIPPEVSAV